MHVVLLFSFISFHMRYHQIRDINKNNSLSIRNYLITYIYFLSKFQVDSNCCVSYCTYNKNKYRLPKIKASPKVKSIKEVHHLVTWQHIPESLGVWGPPCLLSDLHLMLNVCPSCLMNKLLLYIYIILVRPRPVEICITVKFAHTKNRFYKFQKINQIKIK